MIEHVALAIITHSAVNFLITISHGGSLSSPKLSLYEIPFPVPYKAIFLRSIAILYNYPASIKSWKQLAMAMASQMNIMLKQVFSSLSRQVSLTLVHSSQASTGFTQSKSFG